MLITLELETRKICCEHERKSWAFDDMARVPLDYKIRMQTGRYNFQNWTWLFKRVEPFWSVCFISVKASWLWLKTAWADHTRATWTTWITIRFLWPCDWDSSNQTESRNSFQFWRTTEQVDGEAPRECNLFPSNEFCAIRCRIKVHKSWRVLQTNSFLFPDSIQPLPHRINLNSRTWNLLSSQDLEARDGIKINDVYRLTGIQMKFNYEIKKKDHSFLEPKKVPKWKL